MRVIDFSMLFGRASGIKLGAIRVLATLAVGCSVARCGSSARQPFVRLVHVLAGDAPFMTSLVVYDNGALELQGLGRRKFCARDAQAIKNLSDLMRSTTFSLEVSAINADPQRSAPADWEQVAAELPGSEFRVATAREPAAPAQFLREIDTLFRRSFGSHYEISLAKNQ
jgi:hypothetical protein